MTAQLGIVVLLLAVVEAAAQAPPPRVYTAGERNQYEIRVQVPDAPGELIGVSEHRVVRVGGVFFERVRLLRLSESVLGDLGAAARQAPGMELSLDPQAAQSRRPKANHMAVQIILDALRLAYLAASPQLMPVGLGRVGDAIVSPSIHSDDWEDGVGGQRERWATRPLFELKSADAEQTRLLAEFLPPTQTVWAPLREWMTSDCSGRPANFESVSEHDGSFVVSWGCDLADTMVALSNQTGRIVHAEIDSELSFDSRVCLDSELIDCTEPSHNKQTLWVTVTLRKTDPPIPPERLTTDPTDGLEYVKIPAGIFQMGCVPTDRDCYPRETPRHEVEITAPFWLGRTEVPVAAYERFVAAQGREMPAPPEGLPGYNDHWEKKDHPMVKVSWQNAADYCAWAGGRLPSEAEWEYAARGGQDGLKYPWGNERSHEEANFWRTGGRDRWQHTAPTGSFPANAYGLFDMAGNVYEWTADWYEESYYWGSPRSDPKGPAKGRTKVARGGAGFINTNTLRISTRLSHPPHAVNLGVGFRCALPDSQGQ